MSWRILILPKAEADLAWFRRHDRAAYLKCFDLVRDLAHDPRQGLGKPERLKHFDREVWSRRVSHAHRLVYVIYPQEQQVEVVSCKSHYEGLV
ncbi:MAG: Txe/YoeB family addiction module toxin [Anaerolineales bacterium]|nr:Txe/YoeB family addiction module toxin [Anaerolineales bacterium]